MSRLLSRTTLVAVALAAVFVVSGGETVAAGPQPVQNTTVARCRVLVADLLLRSGPGTAFPATARLAQNTILQGISFVQTGVPNGSWVEVQQTPGRPLGFVSADTRFVACDPLARTLPPGRIPPVPAPAGQRVARTRVNGGDLSDNPIIRGPANVNNGQYIILPGVSQDLVDAVIDENGTIRFNDAFGFGVEPLDRRLGQAIGSGIVEVQFQIFYFDDDGNQVLAYEKVERDSPYCVFSDTNGQCIVRRFTQMGYRWPDHQSGRGAPRPFQNTEYTAEITIIPRNEDPILWRWQFEMSGIAVEFP